MSTYSSSLSSTDTKARLHEKMAAMRARRTGIAIKSPPHTNSNPTGVPTSKIQELIQELDGMKRNPSGGNRARKKKANKIMRELQETMKAMPDSQSKLVTSALQALAQGESLKTGGLQGKALEMMLKNTVGEADKTSVATKTKNKGQRKKKGKRKDRKKKKLQQTQEDTETNTIDVAPLAEMDVISDAVPAVESNAVFDMITNMPRKMFK